MAGGPLAAVMQKLGAKLAVSEGRKQQLEAFAIIAGPPSFRGPQEKNVNFGP